MKNKEKLALEAIELMKEFYENLEVLGNDSYFQRIEVIEQGNKILYKSVYDEKEKTLNIENVSGLIHEEIHGFGPCPGAFAEGIEEYIENIDYETKEEKKQKIKEARDIEARGEKILQLLKTIEKEAIN